MGRHDENGEGGPAVQIAPELRGLARVELQLGQRFAGRYEVRALIGRGGMGAVYRVRDDSLDEIVALKVLALPDDRAVDRFVREVRLSRRVTHPNVARTYDFGEHGDVRYLTMEYVAGRSLEEVIGDEAPLAPDRAGAIASQVAAGLAAAHAAGIVHRDLKPANVLLGDGERVVLTDFGIARALGSRRRQATGAAMGTPRYMAPEQASGREIDSRSDIYALGVILFEMVTGALPFPAEDPVAEAAARLDRPAPDPRDIAHVPDSLANLIGQCLSREPAARPQTAAELTSALTDPGDGGTGLSAESDASAQQRSSRPTSSPGLPASAGAPRGSRRATTSSPSAPYAPLQPGSQTLGVLPFAYRGPADHDDLGAAMAEELIDLLSRTRGLRVLAPGAMKRFEGDRDPARVASELGADVVVDGTLQLASGRVRLSARLVEAESGVQRWSDRFDADFEDVFAMQESLGRRVAESLRLELDAAVYRRSAEPEAIGAYLRARRLLRGDINLRAAEAATLLDQCLDRAPDFAPALAARALASVRAWWQIYEGSSEERAWRAEESVRHAEEGAPGLAETHLAVAMYAVQRGDFAGAPPALAKALEIAPTLAEAHHYLGQLQSEAGHVSEGRRRLELARELDPSLHAARFALGRIAALDGDYERALEHVDAIARAGAASPFALHSTRIRIALWSGRWEDAESALRALEQVEGEEAQLGARLFAVAFGRGSRADTDVARRELEARFGNARLSGLIRQKAIESLCAAGAPDDAEPILVTAGSGALVDVDWLLRCELLSPLRDTRAYARALEEVKARADVIWRR